MGGAQQQAGSGKSPSRRAGSLEVVALLLIVVVGVGWPLAGAAHADIAGPDDGATVRGPVLIDEDEGGSGGCSTHLQDTVHEVHDSSGELMHRRSKGSGGAYTSTWYTHGKPLGTYTVTTYGRDTHLEPDLGSIFGGSRCVTTTRLIDQHEIELANRSSIALDDDAVGTTGLFAVLGATLTSAEVALPLEGRTIEFSVAGEVGTRTGTTDVDGHTQVLFPLTQPVGDGMTTYSAKVATDCCFIGSTATGPLEVRPWPTTVDSRVEVTSTPTSKDFEVAAALSVSALGVPIPLPDQILHFRLVSKDGLWAGPPLAATTDASGIASATMDPGGLPPGDYDLHIYTFITHEFAQYYELSGTVEDFTIGDRPTVPVVTNVEGFGAIVAGDVPDCRHSCDLQVPDSFRCSSSCELPLSAGVTIALTAEPEVGARFAGWTAGPCDGSTDPTCSFLLDADEPRGSYHLTGTFEAVPDPEALTVVVEGEGTVSDGGAIDCPETACQGSYPYGATVTLAATPSAGWHLTGWTGDCSGRESTCTVTMDGPGDVGAVFERADAEPPPVPGTVAFEVPELTVSEDAGRVAVSIVRLGGSDGAASAVVALADPPGSAMPGDDFTFTGPATFTWADGEDGARSVPLSLTDNLSVDGERAVILELSEVTGATLGTPATIRVTIDDDDSAPPPPPPPPPPPAPPFDDEPTGDDPSGRGPSGGDDPSSGDEDPAGRDDPSSGDPCAEAPSARFTDVDLSSVHRSAVDCISHLGIAEGATPTTFAPSRPVTRGQMASFLVRLFEHFGVDLPEDAPDAFPDDDGSVHEPAIDALAALGVVDGMTDGLVHLDRPTSRAQAASLLVRAATILGIDLAAGPDAFPDDDGSVHEPAIDTAAANGLILGDLNGRYHPDQPLRRDQMASILARLAT